MSDRYANFVQRLRDSVLHQPGVTEPSVRQAIEARAATLGGRDAPAAAMPADLMAIVDKIALHAYQVTDADVDALKRAGYSEAAIFEITASAALGSGLGRLERGIAALKGEV